MKIFCIGFQKTGTTSLGIAFEKLGYRVCGVCHELLPDLIKGNLDNIKEFVDTCDVFKDNPWPVLYRELDTMYPGSTFILTMRNESDWIRSVVNHFASTPSEMLRYIYGVPYPEGHKDVFLNRYRQHHTEVLAYFKDRPSDLLVLDLETGNPWEKIAPFIGIDIPAFPFPHANKGAYTRLGKMRKYLLKRIRARWRNFRKPDPG